MNEPITIDDILSFLQKSAENHETLPPERYLDAARNLNALLGNETDKLAEMEYALAKEMREHYRSGKSVAAAKLEIQATKEYMEKQS